MPIHKYSLCVVAAVLFLVFTGCKHGAVSEKEHEHAEHAHAVTVWQDSVELFAEIGDLIAGTTAEALVHITDLRDFTPLSAGTVAVSWLQNGAVVRSDPPVEPERPGIFHIELAAPSAGQFDLRFSVRSTALDAHVMIPEVQVHRTASDMPPHADHEEPGAVTFLKEQQWLVPFATQPAGSRTLHETIRALGELKPAGFAEAEVFAPFDGVLMPDPEHGSVQPGQSVRKGDVIAMLAPHGASQNDWSQLLNDYRLAKADYERVAELHRQGAVSPRRFDEARAAYANLSLRLRGVLGAGADVDDAHLDMTHFHLLAPASGVLADVHFRFGQRVEAGEHLVNIVDPGKLWLEAHVPVSESHRVTSIRGGYFTLSGSDSILRISDFGGRLVTTNPLLDPQTRRLPVIFELNNAPNRLRPGSHVQVYLQCVGARDVLAIPETAVLDEEGIPVCYVQTGGETFEKRPLKTGIRDEGWIEIVSGIEAGERVVTRGAYKVRLASLKTAAAAGHGHGH